MALEIGKSYKTLDGSRTYHIFGKKKISPTGYPYAGEESKSGVVAYFNHKGEHSFESNLWLDTDPYLYVPIQPDGCFATDRFVKRSEIPEGDYLGYMKLDPVSYQTICFMNKGALL
jgi:hypothetical protein